jgi:hypothetical protein
MSHKTDHCASEVPFTGTSLKVGRVRCKFIFEGLCNSVWHRLCTTRHSLADFIVHIF